MICLVSQCGELGLYVIKHVVLQTVLLQQYVMSDNVEDLSSSQNNASVNEDKGNRMEREKSQLWTFKSSSNTRQYLGARFHKTKSEQKVHYEHFNI